MFGWLLLAVAAAGSRNARRVLTTTIGWLLVGSLLMIFTLWMESHRPQPTTTPMQRVCQVYQMDPAATVCSM